MSLHGGLCIKKAPGFSRISSMASSGVVIGHNYWAGFLVLIQEAGKHLKAFSLYKWPMYICYIYCGHICPFGTALRAASPPTVLYSSTEYNVHHESFQSSSPCISSVPMIHAAQPCLSISLFIPFQRPENRPQFSRSPLFFVIILCPPPS